MFLLTQIEDFFCYIGNILYFIKDIFYWLFAKKRDFKSLGREIIFVGIDSFFLVSLIALFIGMIIAFQTAYQLQQFKSEIHLASLVALSLVRELGPVIAALIVAARSGASITAGIGSMKISEQVDALEVFGVEPIDYLVVPKFIALLICLPILVIYADLLGIFGGYLVGSLKFAMPFGLYMRMTLESLGLIDLVSGLVKSVFFGSIIAFICCFEGFRPRSSIDVSKVVTRSIVRSFILIIVFDCILTAFFYFI
jgi:phospholipid/cholesterol/gamma-HCH transport system permease protein